MHSSARNKIKGNKNLEGGGGFRSFKPHTRFVGWQVVEEREREEEDKARVFLY